MKKNIILVDYKISDHKDNNFVEVLDEFVGGDWILKEKITNNLHNSIFDNVLRILLYFLFPLTIVFKRYNYWLATILWTELRFLVSYISSEKG